jgi:hypothetical protein
VLRSWFRVNYQFVKYRNKTDQPLALVVLTLEMVDNSSSLRNSLSRSFFHQYAIQAGRLLLKEGSIRQLLHALSSASPRDDTAPITGLRGSQAQTFGKGHESTSLAVHRRVVLTAAMAGWSPLPVAVRQTFASSFSRLHEGYPQRFVRTDTMIIRSPPFQVSQQLWRLLSRSPGAACERCHPMTDRQWSPLNEGGVQSSRETSSLQSGRESVLCSKAHPVGHPHQLAPQVSFSSPGRRSSLPPRATGARSSLDDFL